MSTTGPVADPCPCWLCSGPVYEYSETGHKYVWNNLHGQLRPCQDCGRAKTEYVDYGSYGIYRCWWCTKRTAGSVGGVHE